MRFMILAAASISLAATSLASSPPTAAESVITPWWTSTQAGLIGGGVGIVGGILGSCIGIFANVKSVRPKMPALLLGVTFLGILALLAGCTALALGQPYHVWYILMLPGLVFIPVGLFVRHSIKQRIARDELQRIKALDA